MAIIERPSPNFDKRRLRPIDMLVLHYTGMASVEAALDRLCDATAKVSCHWLIDEAGQVYRLVDESMRAWHAGAGFWAGVTDINSKSIGIELVNPGHEFGYRAFPQPQMAALAALTTEMLQRHPIPAHRILGHSDVAPIRKQDPGEKFDWTWLAARGIGLWPNPGDRPSPMDPKLGLARIGYEDPTATTIAAFQRHWRPSRVDGKLDDETIRRITQVARLCP
jgi:N-acetylmuramoyl-L-alanine amidase